MNWNEANRELDRRREKALLGGGQSKIDKQHAGGELTARERIEMLLDPGTFVEVDGFLESRINDFDLDKRRVPGDGVVTGYGEIDGRQVFVASEDFTVIGGTLGEYHSFKIWSFKISSRIAIINIYFYYLPPFFSNKLCQYFLLCVNTYTFFICSVIY